MAKFNLPWLLEGSPTVGAWCFNREGSTSQANVVSVTVHYDHLS